MKSISDSIARAFPSVVAIVCGYEAVAITSRGKIPTITALQQQHRIIGPIVVGGLVAHFYGEYLDRNRLARRVPLAIANLARLATSAPVLVTAPLAARARAADVERVVVQP
jgi:hypothetical protein